jgi:hypothetical protein
LQEKGSIASYDTIRVEENKKEKKKRKPRIPEHLILLRLKRGARKVELVKETWV